MNHRPVWMIATMLAGCMAVGTRQPDLLRHTVLADGHPITVWAKSAPAADQAILLVHGRTWSALPDFDLQVAGEDLSLMDGLVEAGYATFAVDLRGYGATPRDASEWLTPDRSADDIAAVVRWIQSNGNWSDKPHLFGWSMGSTIAQLMVQRHPGQVASLTLFGYWRDDDVKLAATEAGAVPRKELNTAKNAASDFITPGTISKAAIDTYVAAALRADPVRVDLRDVDQFNALDATQLELPVLILRGEHDPLAPAEHQAKLYARIASGHKHYVTVPDGDHAAFLETPRAYFLHALIAFLQGASHSRMDPVAR